MAGKFHGAIGFGVMEKGKRGVSVEKIEERTYRGDIKRAKMKHVEGDGLNTDLGTATLISIVANPYAEQNYSKIKYVVYMGAKWKVTMAEAKRPRIILTLGGVYNEQTRTVPGNP